ncbi:MAG: T9SS type A sorting domain-containing protein, partial [candidate division Zixibacteria bacterium]|nr:T9SS type A sorting domain-containing protein [candidate division Zixibacteria bacterium]
DTNQVDKIAASDVNADGITLSVADLVYLIRIIVGDAAPYFKQAPLVIKTDLTDGVLSVGAPLAAAWVVLDGEHEPELLAPQMEMKYHYDTESDLTRILVYSMKKGHTFDGAFLAGLEGEVVTFEAATYEGAPVTARLVPDQFALHQCYPNPFNPMTTISFALAVATDYELTVYNTLGREVQSFTGHGQPGIVEIQWNADGHASGIYFYRLTAGDFTDTKKMVLLK